MKLKINIPLRNYKKGQIIKVKHGDRYWLRRLRDAKIDGCVEIVTDCDCKEIKDEENIDLEALKPNKKKKNKAKEDKKK